MRLLACACVRRVWPRVADERSRRAVEVSERFADRQSTLRELIAVNLRAAEVSTDPAWLVAPPYAAVHANASARAATRFAAAHPANNLAEFTTHCVGYAAQAAACPGWERNVGDGRIEWKTRHEAEQRGQAGIIRDLFGNLFREARLNPALLTWNDRTLPKLAQSIYDDRQLPEGTLDRTRLAVLADALEEAGVADKEVLGHLRQKDGIHVRGCWVVDRLLEKR